MRGIILAVGVLVSCVLAEVVYAQGTWPDILIPYVDPTFITIDGLGTDWEDPAVYPQKYRLSSADDPDYFSFRAGDLPSGPEDFSAVLYLGWSTDNMLYVYSQVTDDVLKGTGIRNGSSWGQETIQIMTDADNIGGPYREGGLEAEHAQQFGVRLRQGVPMGPGGNEDDTVCHILAEDGAKWITGPDFFYAVVDYPANTTAVTYAYEFKLALWDEVGLSVDESQRHDAFASFLADTPIGLAIVWNDCDMVPGNMDSKIGTMSPDGYDFWNNADAFNDAYLVGSPYALIDAVAPSSWGAVKASLR
ncbi:MAG: hypothetical protein V1800_01685 [Candidatus Latescibacterota bacterium]